MKHLIALLFNSLLFLYSVNSFGQVFPWTAFFGNEGPEFATDIRQTADEGYVIAGYANQGFSSAYYVVRLDVFGNLLWERTLSKDNYSENAYNVLETADGGFVVIGVATSNRAPWIVKLDAAGDTVWTSQWTSSLPMNSAVLARGSILPDSRIAVIGAQGQLGLVPNMFIVSQDGELLEQRELNAPVPPGWYSGTIALHVEPTSDGGFILTGTAGGGSSSKAFLWKFDQNADSSWVKVYNNYGMRATESVKQLAGGGYILAGFSSPNSEHSCAMRTDESGNVIWFKTYPDNSTYTNATDVLEWKNGEFLITEKRFSAVGELFFKSALLTVDSLGEMISREMIMTSDSSTKITRIRSTLDGGFVMAGEINEYLVAGEQDLFVLKSDPDGNYSGAQIDYVWPGDVNYDGIVNMDDLMVLGVTAGATGPERVDQSIGWYPHYVTNWADTVVTGVNYKHADTDGNGTVNAGDTLAILTNYGLTRDLNGRVYFSPTSVKSTKNRNDLYIIPDEAVLTNASAVVIPLYLGKTETPVSDLYGMRFGLQTDPALVLAESLIIDFTGSWLGDINSDFWTIRKTFPGDGAVDFGLTLNNHQPVSGFGQIGTLKFTLAQPLQPGESLNLDIHFDNLMAYSYDLVPNELITGTFQVVLNNSVTGMDDLVFNYKIHVFPNPVAAGQSVFIQNSGAISSIEILSITGLLVGTEKINPNSQQFTAPVERGVYLLKIYTTTGGLVTKRLIVN